MADDDLVGAARYAFVASMLGNDGLVSGSVWDDLSYRAADLLEMAPEAQRGEEAVQAFERRALSAAVSHIYCCAAANTTRTYVSLAASNHERAFELQTSVLTLTNHSRSCASLGV